MADYRPKERQSRLRCIVLPVPPKKWHIKPFKWVLGISLWNLFVLNCFANCKFNSYGTYTQKNIYIILLTNPENEAQNEFY